MTTPPINQNQNLKPDAVIPYTDRIDGSQPNRIPTPHRPDASLIEIWRPNLSPEQRAEVETHNEGTLAESTRRMYQRYVDLVSEWRAQENLPAAPDVLELFISRHTGVWSYEALAKLPAAHAYAYGPEFKGHPLLIQTLKDAKAASEASNQKNGLKEEEFLVIREFLLSNPTQSNLLTVACIGVCRNGMLRIGEAANLEWRHVRRGRNNPNAGRVYVKYSKTDRRGEGFWGYLSPRTVGDLYEYASHLPSRLLDPQERIFGIGSVALSRRIRNAAIDAGLGDGYSGHSCRIGMAQDLRAAGMEVTKLMTTGRWSNPDMVYHYTKEEEADFNAVAQWHDMYYNGEF